MDPDGARTQKSEPPSFFQHRDQVPVPEFAVAQAGSMGWITTRRRGSSPSELVTTPSMVFTVS